MSDFTVGELRRHTRVTKVPNTAGDKEYVVTVYAQCTCMGNTFTGHCKHADAVLRGLTDAGWEPNNG